MIEYSQQLFHIQILEAAQRFGNDIALTDEQIGKNLTFIELHELSYKFASGLLSLGAMKGDVLCVALENCPEYAIIFLGSALIGCTISGINPESTIYELENYIDIINDVKFLISSADNYETVKNFIGRLALIIIDKNPCQEGFDFMGLIYKSEPNYSLNELYPISLDDTLITPFSSGTTGAPKCVELSHRNFNASTAILKKAFFDELSRSNRRATIAILPFHHGSGFWALCFCLLEGHRTIIIRRFRPSIMMHCIDEYKVDTLNVVPSIISYLCKSIENRNKWNISSLTTVLCGSAPLGKQLSKLFLQLFPGVKNLIQGYGMTELVVLSHITPIDTPMREEKYFGSCGKLMHGFQAKLIHSESRKEINVPNEIGELLLKSEAIMKGYLNNRAATDNAIDTEGWLHTGDVAYYNEEGYYFIVDRLKDLIKVNGLQVCPSELEDLLKSHPNIADAAVIGIPDEDHGQVGLHHLNILFAERVAPFKYLKGGIQIIESLPKTSNGKIKRQELIDLG
ncbi:unnamed protein product [Dracunculus medinensis]|uniref:AMP-binding domain-containing protein n=1 Tax=Dracunculus medinensis TaxID=318479 RepID=A0A0N4UD56_DRAME|nr:unnamed protein product [Dracunculus medinensis]